MNGKGNEWIVESIPLKMCCIQKSPKSFSFSFSFLLPIELLIEILQMCRHIALILSLCAIYEFVIRHFIQFTVSCFASFCKLSHHCQVFTYISTLSIPSVIRSFTRSRLYMMSILYWIWSRCAYAFPLVDINIQVDMHIFSRFPFKMPTGIFNKIRTLGRIVRFSSLFWSVSFDLVLVFKLKRQSKKKRSERKWERNMCVLCLWTKWMYVVFGRNSN